MLAFTAQTVASIELLAVIFSARAIGHIGSCIVGGWLLDKLLGGGHRLMVASLLALAIGTALQPFGRLCGRTGVFDCSSRPGHGFFRCLLQRANAVVAREWQRPLDASHALLLRRWRASLPSARASCPSQQRDFFVSLRFLHDFMFTLGRGASLPPPAQPSSPPLSAPLPRKPEWMAPSAAAMCCACCSLTPLY
jgi:hypothetical protein